MTIIRAIAAGAALCAALTAAPAFAQRGAERDAETAVDTRVSVFKLIRWNMGPLGAMVRGRADVDAAVVETNAARLATLAEMIPDLYVTDTRAFDLETEALDGIWDNMDDFTAKADALEAAALALAETAAGGDDDAILGGIREMASKCGDCHDNYRED